MNEYPFHEYLKGFSGEVETYRRPAHFSGASGNFHRVKPHVLHQCKLGCRDWHVVEIHVCFTAAPFVTYLCHQARKK